MSISGQNVVGTNTEKEKYSELSAQHSHVDDKLREGITTPQAIYSQLNYD